MKGSYKVFLAAAGASLGLFLAAGSPWILPHWAPSAINRYSAYPVTYTRAVGDGFWKLRLEGAQVKAPFGVLGAENAVCHISLGAMPPAVDFHIRLANARLQSSSSWSRASVTFEEAVIVIARQRGMTRVMLKKAVAERLSAKGTADFNAEGQLSRFRVEGTADAGFIRSAFSKAGEIEGEGRVPFLLDYTGKSVDLKLNGRTIFRSNWTMRARQNRVLE